VQGKATVLGHPIHLMLVSFPVAFWSGALITDGIGGLTHDAFWFRMSVALIVMGSVGGAIAALFGYIDYRTIRMSRAARRTATRHMLWSLGCLVIFPLAFLLRMADAPSGRGIAATIGGSLLLLVAGYYGSELSNRYNVGIRERPRD
jgi:uncharacterized membrane protein